MKRDDVIRVGDKVKVINQQYVVRVGYPLIPSNIEVDESRVDACLKVAFPDMSLEEHTHRIRANFKNAIAFAEVKHKGFGGRQRTVFYEKLSSPIETDYVDTIFYKKIGTYYPPTGCYDYEGYYYYNPGGLDNAKTVKILRLQNYYLLVDARDVVKVKDVL